MATIVAFHAHPDDEVLFTGGTLARLVTPMRGRGRMSRVHRLAVAVPAAAFGLVFGAEWFTEPGAAPGGPVLTDVLRTAG